MMIYITQKDNLMPYSCKILELTKQEPLLAIEAYQKEYPGKNNKSQESIAQRLLNLKRSKGNRMSHTDSVNAYKQNKQKRETKHARVFKIKEIAWPPQNY